MFRYFTLLCGLLSATVHATQGYYRYPALHQDTLIFTAEGDLWKTTLDQQYAQRLTTSAAEESQAAISPDGLNVAFVANYSGSTEVYLMPIMGGLPRQLTYENVRVKLHGWTQDGRVLYSYNGRVGPSGNWSLRLVNPADLQVESLPLADAVEGSIDPQGQHLYFTQFGLQVSTDNARAYQGGAKGELWAYQLGSNQEASRLTTKHEGSARAPMVWQDRLYFISNQSGHDNLWSMKLNGRDQQQLTHYTEFSIRHVRLDQGRLVYQLGADIYLYDISSKQAQKLAIELTSDFAQTREHWVNEPLKYLTSATLASKAAKVVLTARGRVAVASTDGSRLVEIATPANSRTRNAVMSVDNQSVFAINDSSGELEIWQYPADGADNARQLTHDGQIFRWNMYPSPDGRWLAHDDKNGDLWLLDLTNLENRKILERNSGLSAIGSLSWSADSQLLAITREELQTERPQILLLDIKDNTAKLLTSEKYASYSPTFSADGQWLYFISDRNFNPYPGSPWGDRNMGASFDRRGQIYAIALSKQAKFPFAKPNELSSNSSAAQIKETPAEPEPQSAAGQQSDEQDVPEAAQTNKVPAPANPAEKPRVDWDNIEKRLFQVPVAPGNYSKLQANKDYLFVLDKVTEPGAQPSLKSLKITPQTTLQTFSSGVADYQISADGKSLFMRKMGNKNDMFIVAAAARFPVNGENIKVHTSDWKLLIQPRQEWQQIFHDAWLMHRDALFDGKLRGVDWQAVKARFQPMLDRLTDRRELNDIFEQMMGELNTLHSQVRGGDQPNDPNLPSPASLGAEFEYSPAGISIKHIYTNDPEVLSRLSPLAKPAVDAREGDLIVAINGQKISSLADLHKALLNQAGKQVLLSLLRDGQSIRTVVEPVSNRDDYMLRYYDWVTQNLHSVQQADERIGYLHLRAMGAADVETFAREFYAQYQKQGLIIDVRRNNGGNIDSWIIEKLLKRAWSFWQLRNGESFTNMQQAFRGHLVVLADQFTYSDGETFTAGIKALNLGKVIGKRTAGAGVWLTDRNAQSDGGIARVAEYPVFAISDGHWITEGRGIAPDIEVDNLPYATYSGKDAQLQQAIEYLQKQIKKQPVKPLKAKPLPADISPAADIIKR